MDDKERFEDLLVRNIQPIRHYVLAVGLFHLFQSGLFEDLREGAIELVSYCQENGLDFDRTLGFFQYLQNEEIVAVEQHTVTLTRRGHEVGQVAPWYQMLVGGYGQTFHELGSAFRLGSDACTRNSELVGVGSCGISNYDAIPLTKELLGDANAPLNSMLDLGCGNAQYIATFCADMPHMSACGVEPSERGYLAAKKLIENAGLEERVFLHNTSAQAFIDNEDIEFVPDVLVLGFVLHEILGQDGRDGVKSFLSKVFQRWPQIHLIVIEVENVIDETQQMQGGLEKAYYNPYYLLHYFTNQKLVRREEWETIFTELGIDIVSRRTTNPSVDSTGLELGYLLRQVSH